jgi:hypothetical protein
MRAKSWRRAARLGTVVPLVALMLVPLAGMMALTLDGGLMMGEERRAQAVADAAAHAAACELARASGSAETARTAASAIIERNRRGSKDDLRVSLLIPPTSGRYAGQSGYAEAVVTRSRPRLFSGMWSRSDLSIRARAVGRVKGTSSPGILILDPSGEGALSVAGSARIVTNGGIQVNSNNSKAVKATNMGYTQSMGLNVTGKTWTDASGKFYITKADGTVDSSLTPTLGASVMEDPLKTSLPTPSLSSLSMGGVANRDQLPTWMQPPANTSQIPGYGTFTIKPGYYDGGLELRGGATVTMQPGIYYMKGGGFTVANGVAVTGEGVMVYVENGNGSFNIQGGANIKFSPPTTGDYAGIMFYQDRNSTKDFNIANGTSTRITGTVYAPGAKLIFAGGAQYGQGGVANQAASRMIVKRLDISNNAFVGVTVEQGNSVKKAYLVE